MPELLACPDCAGPLKNEGRLLRCSCATWPVVEDIPILTPWARNRSFTVEEVLARHLPPPAGLAGKILRRLLPGSGAIGRAILNRDAMFIDLAAALGRTRDLDYFRYRFSDLSFISTAALLAPLDRGPVLDLGCGAGHMINALFRRIPKSVVVGLDLNYALLYLARRFVAPSALYLCADASARLPFRDGAFESSLCADTFRYLADPGGAARELLRVTRGPIVLSHFYYPPVGPEGGSTALDPRDCRAIFSARTPRLHAERPLLETFLEKRVLDLAGPEPGKDDIVSLTAGLEARTYPRADYFVSGSALNPIYEAHEEGDAIRLKRRYLSERYSEAYRKYDAYFPESLTVTKEQVASRDPELVRKFVLLDLPPNYC